MSSPSSSSPSRHTVLTFLAQTEVLELARRQFRVAHRGGGSGGGVLVHRGSVTNVPADGDCDFPASAPVEGPAIGHVPSHVVSAS